MNCDERVKKFDAEHGDFVIINGRILFADGAMREVNPWGCLQDPPADSFECAKRICRFCERKLQLAIEEFEHFKHNFLAVVGDKLQGKYVRPLEQGQKDSIEVLKKLKGKVANCRIKQQGAKIALESSKPQSLIDREVSTEEVRKEASKLLSEIEKIEI